MFYFFLVLAASVFGDHYYICAYGHESTLIESWVYQFSTVHHCVWDDFWFDSSYNGAKEHAEKHGFDCSPSTFKVLRINPYCIEWIKTDWVTITTTAKYLKSADCDKMKKSNMLIITLALSARVIMDSTHSYRRGLQICLADLFQNGVRTSAEWYWGDTTPFYCSRSCRVTGFDSYRDRHPDLVGRERSERRVFFQRFPWYSIERWMNEYEFIGTYYRTNILWENYKSRSCHFL